MITFVKCGYKSKPVKSKRPVLPRKLRRPSGWQFNQVRDIIRYLQQTRCKRRADVFDYLRKTFGVEVVERRMYKFGGVGSFQWMPNLRCYRVQVGAGHINRNGACYNYAACVEIYDLPQA